MEGGEGWTCWLAATSTSTASLDCEGWAQPCVRVRLDLSDLHPATRHRLCCLMAMNSVLLLCLLLLLASHLEGGLVRRGEEEREARPAQGQQWAVLVAGSKGWDNYRSAYCLHESCPPSPHQTPGRRVPRLPSTEEQGNTGGSYRGMEDITKTIVGRHTALVASGETINKAFQLVLSIPIPFFSKPFFCAQFSEAILQ